MSTYAPESLKTVRLWINANLLVPLASIGIVGDTAHAATGTSYHLGKSNLKSSSYSIVESPRDRAGLTDAAAALDIGTFTLRAGGKVHTLRTFSAWLVAQCIAGAADTRDIREVIYSLDGKTVRRWDRLGKRTTGDGSHTSHTHISYFRDSEKRDKTALFKRYLAEITGEDDMPSIDEVRKAMREELAAFGKVDPLATIYARSGEQRTRMAWAQDVLSKLLAKDGGDVDEAAIIKGVLGGLAPDKIAAAIPPAVAAQVVAELLKLRPAA